MRRGPLGFIAVELRNTKYKKGFALPDAKMRYFTVKRHTETLATRKKPDHHLMPNEISQAYRHLELRNQLWLNQRVAWIVNEFGHEHINQVECVLPTSGRLAEYRGGTDEEVIEYFRKITRDIGLDPAKIDFSIEDHLETDDGGPALGLYSEPEEGRFSVALLASQLSDTHQLASTLVHELCHVHLLGYRRIDSQASDHEPLTDLLCVFMGYGIIAANSVIHIQTEGLGAYRQWQTGRRGYMSMSMFGYALALFARLRNEDGQQWRRHMRADVRDAFNHSLRFFQHNGLPDLSNVPHDFVEPILTLESTLQPPPTAALATLYAYSVDPEIPEDQTDYPVDQAIPTDESDHEALIDDQTSAAMQEAAQCVYCGSTRNLSQMVLPAIDEAIVCDACRASIEEGADEAAALTQHDGRGTQLTGVILFASLTFASLFIIWSLVAAIWND